MQISDTQCYRLHVTIALIYLMQLKLLAVVELTRVLDASSRLERPALTPSIIDNDLHRDNAIVFASRYNALAHVLFVLDSQHSQHTVCSPSRALLQRCVLSVIHCHCIQYTGSQ